MQWQGKKERNWERYYLAAQQFYRQNRHLQVPTAYRTQNGLWLGRWIRIQREKYRSGKLSEEQAARLSALGMEWEPVSRLTPAGPAVGDGQNQPARLEQRPFV